MGALQTGPQLLKEFFAAFEQRSVQRIRQVVRTTELVRGEQTQRDQRTNNLDEHGFKIVGLVEILFDLVQAIEASLLPIVHVGVGN